MDYPEYMVYVLQSETSGRRYIGYTGDLEKRLKEHNEGLNTSTKGKGPWKSIYLEKGFKTRSEALKREKILKNMKGGIQFQALLENRS